MCTGRVDASFVLDALKGGTDGVLVCGCHPGDCHYINGNCKAAGRFRLLKRMLVQMGIEPERIRLEWISASESEKYARVVDQATEQIRALGPLHWPSLEEEARQVSPEGDAEKESKADEQVETGTLLGCELRRL